MKKCALNILSIILVIAVIVSMAACQKKDSPEEQPVSTSAEKEVTSETVKIVNIPTDKAALSDMLNASLNYVDKYCYKYKKTLKCTADISNLGSFSSVSNASDAFASVFGEKEITADYDYNADKKLFSDNFVGGPFEDGEIVSISAKQEDNTVVITADLVSENEPTDESGVLHRLGGDYINSENVKSSLGEFKSSATSIGVSASGIKIISRISADDSSLQSLTVEYTEQFALTGITLVKIKGGAVNGSAKTTIEYTNFS